MPVLEDTFAKSLAAVRLATFALPTSVAAFRALDDDHLLSAQGTLAEVRRALDASASVIAGEISHRSRTELGYNGLAQRQGFRTPEKLVQHTTGSTARDAATLVTVGTLVHESEAALAHDPATDSELHEPWLLAVGSAVASGTLAPAAAQAIRSGIGRPTGQVTAALLAAAAQRLVFESADFDADALLARARQLRDELDDVGVAHREQQIHEERCVRRVRRPNGLSRFIIDPDLESAAFLDDLYDHVTAPRRGNVSFVSDEDRAWADAATRDRRTTDQYVHDAFTALLRLAVTSDTPESRGLIGSRQPSVRVLVTAQALESGRGVGRIEGISAPVSLTTVKRIACADGVLPVVFDANGNALDVGRDQRLFTSRQRIALAARDGGCRFPECDRPPSWCESHHIDHWQRDQGRTDLDRGILLCRHHHMLVHNNHWEIEHIPELGDAGYRLIPPSSIDSSRMPRPLPTKSAAMRDLMAVAPT